MQGLLVAIAGGVLTIIAWLSVLRTIFTPRQRSTRAARWTIRVIATISLPIARRLSSRLCEQFLDPCASLALFATAASWLAAVVTGFTLMAWGIYDVPFHSADIADFFLLRSNGMLLVVVALLSTALLLAAFTTHLVRFTGAYSRRERLVARLAGQAVRPPDAEALLADYVRTGSRDRLDDLFAEWTGWLADIWCTHVGYPALTFARPANSLCWLKAAVIVLDAAGLTQAVAPKWAPPHTRSLIQTGSHCLQQLAKQVGVTPASAPVSLHGREEQGFSDSVRLMVDAGLPKQRDEPESWDAFQDLRIHYAPYAAGIAAYLLYEDVDALPRLGDEAAAGGAPAHTET